MSLRSCSLSYKRQKGQHAVGKRIWFVRELEFVGWVFFTAYIHKLCNSLEDCISNTLESMIFYNCNMYHITQFTSSINWFNKLLREALAGVGFHYQFVYPLPYFIKCLKMLYEQI